MKHTLAGVFAVVDHEPIAVGELELLGNAAPREHHVAQGGDVFFGRLADPDDVFFRNDQDVGRRHGTNVVEGDHVLIFECEFRRHFLRDDFAK